jgi:membrane-associated protease RseP (regulator of RpoE activity)
LAFIFPFTLRSQIKTSPPTFVPSIFTGITSTVTTFRTPPKNIATMFDYAMAGPVAGMITSLLAVAVGCQLTSVASDMSLFPALPLEILRQSTLGGGVIEFVLGNDALSLPKAAIGTAAVAGMTVPLHPIAIAGYISLIVNALAVLPIGSK